MTDCEYQYDYNNKINPENNNNPYIIITPLQFVEVYYQNLINLSNNRKS